MDFALLYVWKHKIYPFYVDVQEDIKVFVRCWKGAEQNGILFSSFILKYEKEHMLFLSSDTTKRKHNSIIIILNDAVEPATRGGTPFKL